jgi:hypothetical protein
MSLFRWTALLASVLAVGALTLWGWGQWRWRALTDERLAALEAARGAASERAALPAPSPAELATLPAPVRRYFAAVLSPGVAPVAAVEIEHRGTFDMGGRWSPFASKQRVTMRRPGFVWDGRIAMLPGMAAHVHDAYIAGQGVLHATLGGAVPLVNLSGGRELDEGELMRWFAEAAWYPTALLPSQGVRWEAVDDHSARGTFHDGAQTLTLTFFFDAEGLMTGVRAEARGRLVDGKSVPTPWEGRWSDYEWRDGLRVPTRGEVAWVRPEAEGGRLPYWRGEVTALRYEFAG